MQAVETATDDLPGLTGPRSVNRALIWKEWRESRRALVGGVIALAGLPAIITHGYWWLTEYNDSFGLTTLLAMLLGPFIASMWGAHALCRDVVGPRGRFLFAQPVGATRIIVVKGLTATALLLGLMAAPGLVDLAIHLLVRSHAYDVPATFYISYIFTLTGVLGVSFLAAALFRRLVAAVLVGLAAALVLIVAPTILAGVFLPREPSIGLTAIPACIGLWLCLVSISFAGVLGRRTDRPALSMRVLSWGGVAVVLACTTLVSDAVRSDTQGVHAFDATPFGAASPLWSRGRTVYWLGADGPTWSSTTPSTPSWSIFLAETSFDGRGRVRDEIRTELDVPGHIPGPRTLRFDGHLHADEDSLILLDRQSVNLNNMQDWRLFRLALGENRSASRELLARLPPFGLSRSWRVSGNRLVQVRRDGEWTYVASPKPGADLEILELTGDAPALIGTLRFDRPWSWTPIITVDGDTVTVAARSAHARSVFAGFSSPRLTRVYISDPSNPRILIDSQEYPRPATPLGKMRRPDGAGYFACAVLGDRLAMASAGGLWLYEMDRNGRWRLLGKREATWIEMLAGRGPSELVWRGDRIYESSWGFGLLVYDVSDVAHPRRIAHSGGTYDSILPLDHGLVALVRQYAGLLEIHKLPE